MHYSISNFQTHQCWLIASSFNWRWSSSVVVFGIVFRYKAQCGAFSINGRDPNKSVILTFIDDQNADRSPLVQLRCFERMSLMNLARLPAAPLWWVRKTLYGFSELSRLRRYMKATTTKATMKTNNKAPRLINGCISSPDSKKKEEKEGQKNLRNSSSINSGPNMSTSFRHL